MPGQLYVSADNGNIAADHRRTLYVRISADYTDIAANLSVPFQFNVTADNNKIAADLPFQSQVVPDDHQVSYDVLVFTDVHVAAEHGNIALQRSATEFVSPLPGLCEEKYDRPKRDNEHERRPASGSAQRLHSAIPSNTNGGAAFRSPSSPATTLLLGSFRLEQPNNVQCVLQP